MKKSAVIFLAALALSLSACGNTAANEQTTAETVPATLAETAAEITEAETETTATAAETTSETTEATTTVTETEKVCTCESEFQHACCEYLNGLNFLAGGVYYGDINGDDKPEAVIEINPFELTYVLYENESGFQVLNLETMSSWGAVRYIADTKQIIYSPEFGHSSWGTYGHGFYCIYDWNGSDYEVTFEMYRAGGSYYEKDGVGYADYGQAYIDGEEVDNDTYEVKLAEFEKIINETEYFPIVYIYDRNLSLNPDPETYKDYIRENFHCFDNWELLQWES